MKFSAPAFYCLLAFCATSAMANTANPPVSPAPATAPDGFRSAKYGMTLDEVKRAAMSDLRVPASSLKVSTDPLSLTTDIAAPAFGLVPELGKAEVVYVLGYSSKKLDAVIVTWDSRLDKADNPAALLKGGGVLQHYFAQGGFADDQSYGGRLLRNGDLVLFHGAGSYGRTVNLLLQGNFSKPPKKMSDSANKAIFTPHALVIGYIENPTKPDVFSLPKGSF